MWSLKNRSAVNLLAEITRERLRADTQLRTTSENIARAPVLTLFCATFSGVIRTVVSTPTSTAQTHVRCVWVATNLRIDARPTMYARRTLARTAIQIALAPTKTRHAVAHIFPNSYDDIVARLLTYGTILTRVAQTLVDIDTRCIVIIASFLYPADRACTTRKRPNLVQAWGV
jgi:hypothetical protein